MREFQEGLSKTQFGVEAIAVDVGLRRYMVGIYSKVGLGLVLAAAVASATAGVPFLRDLLFTIVTQGPGAPRVALTFAGSLVAFAPLFVLLSAGGLVARPTPARTGALYWSVVTLMGASLAVLFMTFTGLSIGLTLAGSALGFGALSLIGYTTARDLTGVGGFLLMGLVGLVASLAANLVLHNPMIDYVTGVAGVLIFSGLIACDTQRLKMSYHQLGGDKASMAVATDLGALSLFINFLNLFQLLLMMVSGQRRQARRLARQAPRRAEARHAKVIHGKAPASIRTLRRFSQRRRDRGLQNAASIQLNHIVIRHI